ncbi:MAG: radical SAM protein [Candidatus Korarchaeum sp.]
MSERFMQFNYKGHKVQLRIEPYSMGSLVVDASRLAYLNHTAALMVKAFLSGGDWRDALRELRAHYRGLRKRDIREHFKEIVDKVSKFIEGYGDPVTDLGFRYQFPDVSLLSAPLRVDLALTYDCNNICLHCYSDSPADVRELTTDEWKEVLRILRDLGVPQVTFTGGEPTLREDLVELVEEAQRLGIVSGVVTNGTLLSEELSERLARAGLDYIQITLEASDPEVHERITGVRGSWERTVEGIRNILRTGVYVSVNSTLLRENSSRIADTLRFVAGLGVHGYSLNRLIYSGRAKLAEDLEPDFDEMRRVVSEAKELCLQLGLDFTWYGVTRYCEIDPIELGLGPKFCSACSIAIAVEPDGSVIPCQSHYLRLGNILRDDWERIWYSEECRRIREAAYVGDACLSCPVLGACRGGCPLESEVRPYPPNPPEVEPHELRS